MGRHDENVKVTEVFHLPILAFAKVAQRESLIKDTCVWSIT